MDKEVAYIFPDNSGELLIPPNELEKAEQLILEISKKFPIPETFTKEDEEKLIDSLIQAVERIKDETGKVKPIINFDLSIPYMGENNED